MALLRKNRTAQYPLYADFTFTVADTLANTAGVVTALNVAGAQTYEPLALPPGAVIVGGELVVNTASNDAGAATLSVGDSANATRYLGATTIKTAGRTALTLTGYNSLGEDIRLTISNATGGATTGSFTVRIAYVVAGRSNEVQAS